MIREIKYSELDLQEIEVSIVSLPNPQKGYPGLVDVLIQMCHRKKEQGFPSVSVRVPIHYPLSWSIEAVREEAIIRAREIIGAAQFLSIPPSEPSG